MKSFIFKSFSGIWHPSESSGHPRAKSGKVGHAWASLGMNTPKCHTRLLPSMDVYLHAKSQSEISTPSRDIIVERILRSDWPRAFWPKTQEQDFSWTCGFRRMIKGHKIFDLRQKKVHINGLIFCQNTKKSIFRLIFLKISQTRFFLKNRALSLFSVYGPLTSYQKSEKTDEPILRKTLDRQTERQTDGQTDRP